MVHNLLDRRHQQSDHFNDSHLQIKRKSIIETQNIILELLFRVLSKKRAPKNSQVQVNTFQDYFFVVDRVSQYSRELISFI
ncbi:unnamed protein product [Adineta ricciae]|uniref:Uncharacterized protein n=1 Tax=Adineta ricciae TaxID=249248 RepID=A0A815W7E3_ADIRI|nr:unnamed protein product [Adineta ricciae]